MTSAVLYARVSTDLQRPESIDDQFRLGRALADRLGATVVAEFSDKEQSGALRDRPGLDALMTLLAQGGIDLVIADTLDRFHRDEERSAAFYKRVTFHGTRIATVEDGLVSKVNAGLRAIMGSLYLDDLARRTHRGLEGVVLSGRIVSPIAYGYRALHRLGPDGTRIPGLREIAEDEAKIVRRIFTAYADDASPLAISQQLNRDGIPGPGGRPWREDTIRGRANRAEGILRNPLYDGRNVWNRRQSLRDPDTGRRLRRARDATAFVETKVEHLRVVPPDLWQAVQDKLAANAATPKPTKPSQTGFWDRRRPRHLLTSKVVCGLCGTPFASFAKDYLRCPSARGSACKNHVSIRRPILTARVVASPRRHLLPPDLTTAFIEAYAATWQDLTHEATATARRAPDAIAALDRKINNLIDALADGAPSTNIRAKLSTLDAERATLVRTTATHPTSVPNLPTDLANRYRQEIDTLTKTLEDRTTPALLDAARRLIDRVIITPPKNDNDPPTIELVGDLTALIQLAIQPLTAPEDASTTAKLLRSLTSSVKQGPGAKPLALLTRAGLHTMRAPGKRG